MPGPARKAVGGESYLALYGPVWWAWVEFVLYTDRFGTDDISDRLMTLVQIGATLVTAAAAMEAMSRRAPAFAIAYGVFRLILAARYALAARYVRQARPECTYDAHVLEDSLRWLVCGMVAL